MTLQIKIVGIDELSHSVLVKYSSEKSKKLIDEYDAVALQISDASITSKELFIASITQSVQGWCDTRDIIEQKSISKSILDTWTNFEVKQARVPDQHDLTAEFESAVLKIKDNFPTFSKIYLNSILSKEFNGFDIIPAYNHRGVFGVEITSNSGMTLWADRDSLRDYDDCLKYLFNLGIPIIGMMASYFSATAITHTERVYGKDTALNITGPDNTFVYFNPTFELAKKFKHHKLTIDLNTLNDSGFTYKEKLFQSDSLSRERISNINAVVLSTDALVLSATEWKAQDNSIYTFDDVTDWKNFFSAMINQTAVNYQTISLKKKNVDRATTQRQLEAITVLG